MAMAAMMGGMSGVGGALQSERRRRPTADELEYIKQKNLENFQKDLEIHNTEKAKEFKHWTLHTVKDIEVLAYNQKNAHKILDKLLKSNGLSF